MQPNVQPTLSGATKAAIFLLCLEQEETVRILEHLREDEVRMLRGAVEKLQPVAMDTLDHIYTEFTDAYKKGWTSLQDGDLYLRELVRRAQGEERAERCFAALPAPVQEPNDEPEASDTLSAIAEADPTVLRFTIADEHPQVAAAVLAHLEPAVAAEIIQSLEPQRQAEVVLRISSLEPIPVTAFNDAASSLRGVKPDWLPDMREVDGTSMAANILGEMATDDANGLIGTLASTHPDEATRLQQAMFTIDNLLDADTRGLQALLKEVQTETLLIALKTASKELQDKIFGCMSKRAASMLAEEAELLPPMRLSEVEAAQQQIVDNAMRLMSEGKLHVKGRGEDLV